MHAQICSPMSSKAPIYVCLRLNPACPWMQLREPHRSTAAWSNEPGPFGSSLCHSNEKRKLFVPSESRASLMWFSYLWAGTGAHPSHACACSMYILHKGVMGLRYPDAGCHDSDLGLTNSRNRWTSSMRRHIRPVQRSFSAVQRRPSWKDQCTDRSAGPLHHQRCSAIRTSPRLS